MNAIWHFDYYIFYELSTWSELNYEQRTKGNFDRLHNMRKHCAAASNKLNDWMAHEDLVMCACKTMHRTLQTSSAFSSWSKWLPISINNARSRWLRISFFSFSHSIGVKFQFAHGCSSSVRWICDQTHGECNAGWGCHEQGSHRWHILFKNCIFGGLGDRSDAQPNTCYANEPGCASATHENNLRNLMFGAAQSVDMQHCGSHCVRCRMRREIPEKYVEQPRRAKNSLRSR